MANNCAAQVFSNVTTTAWACLKAAAAAQNITIGGDNGTIKPGYGVEVSYNYDRAKETLSITCSSNILSCATVNAKVHELIDNSGCISAG